eukprot:COSAG01_NODE_3362_length_6198_cov_2.602394_7_plen_127_part_00
MIFTRRRYEGKGSFYDAKRDGHIPGAIWFPWKQVFDKDQGNLKPKETLRSELEALGVTNSTMVVAYCTGGIRSGFLYLVMRWCGFQSPQNYDGSWWDWSSYVTDGLRTPLCAGKSASCSMSCATSG